MNKNDRTMKQRVFTGKVIVLLVSTLFFYVGYSNLYRVFLGIKKTEGY